MNECFFSDSKIKYGLMGYWLKTLNVFERDPLSTFVSEC